MLIVIVLCNAYSRLFYIMLIFITGYIVTVLYKAFILSLVIYYLYFIIIAIYIKRISNNNNNKIIFSFLLIQRSGTGTGQRSARPGMDQLYILLYPPMIMAKIQ